MYGNDILGRVKKVGRESTYSPYANNQDLINLSEQIFYIQNKNAFADEPVVSVSTGLVTNAVNFLGGDFTAKIIDIAGNVLVEKLTPKIVDVGKLTFPQINEINWFDVIGMQGTYWLHEQWKGKILVINGKFETTAITANEINQFTGIIAAWGGDLNSIPERTLPCFGQEVSRYYYANLFEKIGTSWGNGDGAKTFNLPDGRDGVLKGVSGKVPEGMPTKVLTDPDTESRFNDKGGNKKDQVGSYQRFAIQSHSHSTQGYMINYESTATSRYSSVGSATANWGTGRKDYGSGTYAAGSASTRDNNLGVYFIIFI